MDLRQGGIGSIEHGHAPGSAAKKRNTFNAEGGVSRTN
jgi:hypothetical protein